MGDVTLSSALKSNLVSLQDTQKLFDQTQTRLTTGKRVNTPIDDPSNFYAASSLSNRAESLEGRLDGMGQAIQAIKAADNGINAMASILDSMKAVVENALTTAASDENTRHALGKQFNKLLVQLEGFADDSAYGGVSLLKNDQELDVQLGESFNESVFNVTGFHVAGADSLDADGEVQALDDNDLPPSWKIGADSSTGAVVLGEFDGKTFSSYNPLDENAWTRIDDVDRVVATTTAGTYLFTYEDGTTQSVPDVAKLEYQNGSYWAAASSSSPVSYGEIAETYAFALNKVEDNQSVVGIKSYGTDQTTMTGHEINWGNGDSYTNDLNEVLESMELVEEVLETRQKLFTFDQATIALREEYTNEFISALETGVDQLTLADLNEESTNLLALQTAQQLGVTGLSLANQNTQNVLRILG